MKCSKAIKDGIRCIIDTKRERIVRCCIKGKARVEKISFDAYNESEMLKLIVERTFSLAKRKFGLGKIWTKLENTSKSLIILSIIALNLEHLLNILLCILNYMMFRRKEIRILSC